MQPFNSLIPKKNFKTWMEKYYLNVVGKLYEKWVDCNITDYNYKIFSNVFVHMYEKATLSFMRTHSSFILMSITIKQKIVSTTNAILSLL